MLTTEAPYFISSVKIISDEDQALLIQIRDNLRLNYFAIGDVANKYIYMSAKGKYAVDAQTIYDAVGKFVGKSGRTVRYYAEQSMFYDQATRDKYDILPFSFFVFARSMDGQWNDVLEYAMLNPQKRLSAIRTKFIGGISDDTIEEYEEQPVEDSSRSIRTFLSVIIDLSANALRLSNSVRISDDQKEVLKKAALQIRDIVKTLAEQDEI
jgi:hypothetical protein